MNRRILPFALLLLLPAMGRGADDKALLLRKPTLSRTHVAFVYGGDLWIVPREGGDARRLTSGIGVETDPYFSPDGSQIAFTGEYEGNVDVYVVASSGGVPRRLTYHPGPDQVTGWMPDGKAVLFRSGRSSNSHYTRLFTVPVDGSFPTELPLPMAYEGSFSPDGSHIAYVPLPPAFRIWKHYRGGRASVIWIADLADSHIEKVPRDKSNDFNPLWLGERVYFLSDRNGPVTLFAYDTRSHEVSQVLANNGLDIKSAAAGPDAIVYEQFGSLHLFDPSSGKARPLDVRVAGDLPGARPRFEKAARFIQHAGISPSGVRAVFEARGEIVTVPAEKGDPRNLTNSPGVADRDPAWSPDGRSIACFCDESGEYQLHVHDARGTRPTRKYALGDPPSFYYSPVWSPDSKKIAYTDKRLNLWCMDLADGKNTRVDTDRFDDRTLDPTWAPDSRWLAYTKQLKNHLHAVFVCDLQSGQHHQLTDGMSDARYPTFDKSGKYLYFTASTDAGPTLGWEMSMIGRPVTRSVYAIVLRDDLPSPLAPQSDEEKSDEDRTPSKKDAAETPARVRVDLEAISQRTVALPIPARNYGGLQAGKAGVLYLLERPPAGMPADEDDEHPPSRSVHRFDLQKRKGEKILEDVAAAHLSHNGEKLLYQQGHSWFIVAADAPPRLGQGALALDAVEIRIDPRAEWKQMYHEAWRLERDFLYDPGHHGLDLQAAEKKYAPYVDGLASRSDLSYLFAEMLGELTLGHVYVIGGDAPPVRRVKGGLLGADFRIEHDRYRFARIYNGESWNPHLRAPLTQPGNRVKEGEFLLAVNGRPLHAADNPYRPFEGTAGKSIVLRVGPDPEGKGARDVTVVPVEDEDALRNLAWIEDNRRQVDRMTGGRVAYVYVPDTALGGFTSFNRYFFAQVGKDGAIIDERFNRGGIMPDHIVDTLRRRLINIVSTREGEDVATPQGAIFGPKVMIINEMAGSGGDELPHYFRQAKVGPLVGKRTWGGLVGIGDYPPLLDGGIVTAPNAGIWFPSGQWEVENHGVDPDVEVEFDPQAWRQGHDPQLEKAVALVLEELKKQPPAWPKRPAYPNYHTTTRHPARPEGGNSGGTP